MRWRSCGKAVRGGATRRTGGRLIRMRGRDPARRRWRRGAQMQTQAAAGRIRTSLVGSYAQPSWLLDRDKLRGRFPPRVRAKELWRVDPQYLEEAQDDATRLAILDQERAGL